MKNQIHRARVIQLTVAMLLTFFLVSVAIPQNNGIQDPLMVVHQNAMFGNSYLWLDVKEMAGVQQLAVVVSVGGQVYMQTRNADQFSPGAYESFIWRTKQLAADPPAHVEVWADGVRVKEVRNPHRWGDM